MLAVILLFITPLLSMSQKQDSIVQAVIDHETTQFIDAIRNRGYVSKDMYQSYLSKIDKTGNIYNIEICHAHKKTVPNYDETTNTILDGYYSYFYNTYQDAIFAAFDEGKDYFYNQGDYISIIVVNRNKTMSTRILEALSVRSISTEQIIFTYGGMIRDEVD